MRPRRLRRTAALRDLVAETTVRTSDLVAPLFVREAITEPQRRRWATLLMDAADEVGLPADPEFRAAFTSYIEWGTRIALSNSRAGATPPLEAPMPHWGWGVAPPYIPAK